MDWYCKNCGKWITNGYGKLAKYVCVECFHKVNTELYFQKEAEETYNPPIPKCRFCGGWEYPEIKIPEKYKCMLCQLEFITHNDFHFHKCEAFKGKQEATWN
jgi:NAD-dependent SIR2 family protein deacetylase